MGRSSPRFARSLVAVFLVLLPLTLFHRALFLGDAFLPADLLGYSAPWSRTTVAPPPAAWNVLRYDGITQFYPWRLQAARSMRSGRIPLWNPFTFGAAGGAPLLANSQSAPLYPLNAIYYLFPPSAVWYVFGLSAALHLLIASWGMYRLLRSLQMSRVPSLLGAGTFGLSGPIVCWLSLPTFLNVACWLPWLLLSIQRAHYRAGTTRGRLALVGAGVFGGLALLAGHLQVAFYVLLAGALYGLHLGWERRRVGAYPLRWLVAALAVAALAVAVALPQLLPSLDLSRVSARAQSGPPTMESYGAYIANALPVRNLVTLLVPDFFGSPNPVGPVYWNTNNYGEWAAYIGVLPVVLATFALALPWKRTSQEALTDIGVGHRRFFAALALFALLLAMGTYANLPFFFIVPGYSQTGNPARCLVLLAFALSALTALGLSALLSDSVEPSTKRRAALIAVAAPVLVAAVGASQAASWAHDALPNVAFGDLMTQAIPGVLKALVLLVLTVALFFSAPRLSGRGRIAAGCLTLFVAVADLFGAGMGYNVTSPHGGVYPVTPGIAFLQEHAGDALVAPINRSWSLGLLRKDPPRGAVLPPNALTVYGLHDVGGYDSLFPAEDKRQIAEASGGADPSPPENGNMVFVKTAEAAVALGARYLVFSPSGGAPPDLPPGLTPVYSGSDLLIYENPASRAFDPQPATNYRPAAFRIGLFVGLCGLAAAIATVAATRRASR